MDDLYFETPPVRVVSLVPSLTETLFEMGFGQAVVGITDYCIYPKNKLDNVTRVGGPKYPSYEAIRNLKPDLVLTNPEENPREVVEKLQDTGIKVWVSLPKTVHQVANDLWTIAGFFHDDRATLMIRTFEMTLEWSELSTIDLDPVRYFCPLWQENHENAGTWWMTFNDDTYSGDLLKILGGMNIFAKRNRKYPLNADLGVSLPEPDNNRDVRYPRVTQQEVINNKPSFILLPSEPFHYNVEYLKSFYTLFEDTPAAKNKKIILIDGTLITWYGTRSAKALIELADLFRK